MQEHETISIPIIYIEASILMLGAFLIGYIGASWYYKSLSNKSKSKFKERERLLESKLKRLQDDVDRLEENRYAQDRMNQDLENVQFHERAFSDRIVSESIGEKPTLNFDIIGASSEEEKDNLQEIDGIGPYTEAKLNDLGIFTFDQISKFTDNEIAIVTELIKFFPDRIKNDQWVGKARDLIFQNNSTGNDSKKKMIHKKTT